MSAEAPPTSPVGRQAAPGGSTPALPVTTRSTLLPLLLGVVALFSCLVVFGVFAQEVRRQEAIALDGFLTPFLHGLTSPALDTFFWTMTTIGSTLVVTAIFITVEAILLLTRYRRAALFLAVAILGSVLLNASLKLIFERPRPQLDWAQTPTDYSFPSGHTMNSVVFYVALALIVWSIAGRRAGIVAVCVAVVLAVLIGVSRIYLGAHYFSDVAAGFLAGLAWLLIVAGAFDAGPWVTRRSFARRWFRWLPEGSSRGSGP